MHTINHFLTVAVTSNIFVGNRGTDAREKCVLKMCAFKLT